MDVNRGSGWKWLIRTLCFMVFGICAFFNPLDKWNLYNIIFGAVVGIFFGGLFKFFLNSFLTLFNGKLKKEKGKQIIKAVVADGMLFLVPFAAMLLAATFALHWSMTGGIISAGIMAVGTAAAIEMGIRKGKQELRNTIATAFVSYIFSFLWTMSYGILIKAPGFIEFGVKFVSSIISGRGGNL